MRKGLLAALLLLTLLPWASAQEEPVVRANLSIEVQPDHAERLTLRFEGLRRLTEYVDLCLPEGAAPLRVFDEVGDMPYTKKEEEGRTSVSFRARGETATVLMSRGPADAAHAPFLENDANFCVPQGTRTTVRVGVPAGHELYFLGRGGTIAADGRSGTLERDGPLHAFYAYEAPLPSGSGLVRVDAAPFRIVVAEENASHAEEVARIAAPALDAALQEAGLTLPWDHLRVRYAPATDFTWEAGHYGGRGLVTVRQSTLDPDPREGYPLVPARVLVHEAFHAASSPEGRGPVETIVDWWLEGSARHAERHVTRLMPNATRHCERTATEARCWDFDDRIRREDLEQAYAPTFRFETRWTPSLPQTDDARSFYYAYSAFLVAAYIETHGVEAYRHAWRDVLAAFSRGEGCPCREGWLEETLLEAAGISSPLDLYRPYGELHDATPALFEARVKPFVKDEKAFQDELERLANGPGLFLPLPGVPALAAALALVALALRRRD